MRNKKPTKNKRKSKDSAKKLLQLQKLNLEQLDAVAAAGFIWLD